jgi:DNA-binding NtrC family response regulator
MTEYQKAQVIAKYQVIQKALARNGNCKARAARDLQMDRKTIYNVIKSYEGLEL